MTYTTTPQAQNSPIELEVQRIGSRIFEHISGQAPSLFRKSFWAGHMMSWSMKKPHLKRELFRLVDVLPSLESSADIITHLQLYIDPEDIGLEQPILDRLLRFAVGTPPHSLRAKIVAAAIRRGVREMASQFIAGASAAEAHATLRHMRKSGIAYTIDLLGEYSVSEREALEYLARYRRAIEDLSTIHPDHQPIIAEHPGDMYPQCVSVKLSALYSQTNNLNYRRSVTVLSERLAQILEAAEQHRTFVYVDAEDSAHNEIIYDVVADLALSRRFRDFPLLGLVIQAYHRSAESTVRRFINIAQQRERPLAIRLVKGAYWDYETTQARLQGWASPLFDHKYESDQNYERLTDLLLDHASWVLPAFASHNIRSLAYACASARARQLSATHFELQMLYGMAEPIAKAFASQGYLVRMYVPLGELIPGMGYLVRRLLENTSNDSFLRHTFADAREASELLRPPSPHMGARVATSHLEDSQEASKRAFSEDDQH